jgi:hypothetical protein
MSAPKDDEKPSSNPASGKVRIARVVDISTGRTLTRTEESARRQPQPARVATPSQWATIAAGSDMLVRALRSIYAESRDPNMRALAESVDRLREVAEQRAAGRGWGE